MRSLSTRRTRSLLIVFVLSGLLVLADLLSRSSLHFTELASGWLLLALCLLLTLFNLRKKLAFLPLGSAALWLQIHIYAGLFTVVVFLFHIGWRIPNGVFEGILGFLFVGVSASGVMGLFMSRTFSHRLTLRGEPVLYETIPVRQKLIQEEVEKLVLNCLAETSSTAIPEFYARKLKGFLETRRNLWLHLVQSTRPIHALKLEIRAQTRYLNEAEREYMRKIAERVQLKDTPDYQFALQSALKYWLFVHIPLTYALLTFAAVHVVLVYAFLGGMR